MNHEEIVYSFKLETAEIKQVHISLEQNTLNLVHPIPLKNLPAWTHLDFNQCPNCPLKHRLHCPIAANISVLASSFTQYPSYQKYEVHVQMNSRSCVETTDVQSALSSILGIYMVTSGCPVMDKLRPMVYFHLPFATPLETQYRAITMYLVAQYLRNKQGKKPDWDLKGFIKMYAEIQKVNFAFSKRLSEIDENATNKCALIILDDIASLIHLNFQINEEIPAELESIFQHFLDEI